MQLNLPIIEQLKDCQNILIAGAGGGFDIYIGLPIYFTLRDMGKTVHLANYSFSDIEFSQRLISDPQLLLDDLLLGVRGDVLLPFPYFPEGYLAQWFKQEQEEAIPIWLLGKVGFLPLFKAYQTLIDHLGGIDAIILIDGGVDSLMRGDEIAPGSMLEDTISIAALNSLPNVPVKIIGACGFGTEVEERVCHYLALENMSALIRDGGFLGSCSLTPQMNAFELYAAACEYTWNQANHQQSHISTRIIPAVRGEFGDVHLYKPLSPHLLSPLMSIFWFFDLPIVADHNYLLERFLGTETTHEAFHIFLEFHKKHPPRPRKTLPY